MAAAGMRRISSNIGTKTGLSRVANIAIVVCAWAAATAAGDAASGDDVEEESEWADAACE